MGYMRSDASWETAATPAANNVNLLVKTVILHYMALRVEQGNFASVYLQKSVLNSALLIDSLTPFEQFVNGVIIWDVLFKT